eukprot:1923958-Amphidinium_carterae.1
MAQVVKRRPEFEGIERGLDTRTLNVMRKLSAKKDHSSSAVLNAASGGLWTDERTSKVYGADELCRFCQQAEGSASHLVLDCPAFDLQRKEVVVQPREETIPPRVFKYLVWAYFFPTQLPTVEERLVATTTDLTQSLLLMEVRRAEPSHRRCGCGTVGDTTRVTYPLPGCWQS